MTDTDLVREYPAEPRTRHVSTERRSIANPWSVTPSAPADPARTSHRPNAATGHTPSGRGDPLARLTAREREVLDLLAEGRSNSSIAERLRTTQRTIETHTSRIFTKLDLEATPATHRRVLAALAQLEATGLLMMPTTASGPSHGS